MMFTLPPADQAPGNAPTSGAPLPIVADLHSHTCHSHGRDTVAAMYEAAKARGLVVFGFTEHSPRPRGYCYPTDYQEKLAAGFDRYVSEVRAIKEKAGADGMTVLLGLEIDYIPGQEDYARHLREAYDYDYVIGGLHFQGVWGFDYAQDDWQNLDRNQRFAIYAQYYRDLAAMCRTGLFHIAAHPDLIKLFSVQDFHLWLAQDEALALIDDALHAMKEHHVLMEISSAGLRKPCKEIYPCPLIMQRAADLKLDISFASDAHCVNTPAYAFDQLARYAASFGLSSSTVLEKGRARTLPFKAL